jgi:putative DNA primase/helicase
MKLDLPERDWLIDRLISTSSLSMVYAERGLGKTWFVLSLALAVVKGENFLDYQVNRPWHVLYVDGEMSLVDLQSRIKALEPDVPATFVLLPSERLFKEAQPLNLHSAEDQESIMSALDDMSAAGVRPDLIIFDNLSSLSGGVDENDNSALDGLLRWLVKLKHHGFAVLLVHHAGKSGAQRGASRREDLLDTSMLLAPPGEDAEPHDGASFTLLFPKTRGPRPKPSMLEMRLMSHEGHLTWAFNEPKKIDRRTELLRLIWERNPKTQKELAGLINLSEASISGYCKRLRRSGLLEPEGLTLTMAGRDALVEAYPELEPQMLRQGDLLSSGVI